MNTPFLQVSQAAHQYPQPGRWLQRPRFSQALSDINLQFDEGERVGLVGASGSGKSTLLKAMLALETLTEGEIYCEGRLVRPGRASALRWYRQRVQYIPQDPAGSLAPHLSVFQLIAEPLRRLGHPGKIADAVQEACEQVALSPELLTRNAQALSGGQAQRVAIARAIALKPRFLLADEPVSGLDLPLRQQIITLLAQIARQHQMGLLIVSHDISAVAALCERVLVMHQGRIVEDRPLAQLLTHPAHAQSAALLAAVPVLSTDLSPTRDENKKD
ncbi:ABC transporter ATP-binding protein [Lonsdalea quercina]|uniref:ABC transporter ATP-binding protein n=1 Tax=Lonsdalea quercina TaxID=71657 RepID=UPI003974A8C4